MLCFALRFKYRLKVSLQGLITIKSPAAANNRDDADQILLLLSYQLFISTLLNAENVTQITKTVQTVL